MNMELALEDECKNAFTGRYDNHSSSCSELQPKDEQQDTSLQIVVNENGDNISLGDNDEIEIVDTDAVAAENIVNNDVVKDETSSEQKASNTVENAEMEMHSSIADLKNNKNSINKEEEEIQQLGGAIIWSSEQHIDNYKTGWTRDRWNHCEDKKLFYTGKITHVSYSKSLLQFPWATSYESIQIAFYQNPNLILILKHPKPILFLSTQPSKKELQLEAIIDPAVCKLRLSNWTTPSSIHYLSSPEHHHPNNLHKSCFELVTPTQVWTFSVLSPQILKRSSSGDTAMPKEEEELFIRDTCMWEAMFSQALLHLHQPISNDIDNSNNKVIPDFYSWRHAFILGTLHSYVVTCDKDLLQLSLQQLSKNNVSVNSLDEYGLAPLHYACNQRDSVAVGLLGKLVSPKFT